MDCSVIIPTRGRPHLLAQAIGSVWAQSVQPREVVVVVDGPDEASVALATELDCLVVAHERSLGEGAARNAGLREASGDWVAFLDDDDLWHPDRLLVTASYLGLHPEARAVNAGFWTFGPAEASADLVAIDLPTCLAQVTLGAGPWTDMAYLDILGRSFELLLERNRGVISTATVRRTLLNDVGGFPERLTCAADWMMFLNVARRAEWHVIEGQRLAFVRRHAESNTAHNTTNLLVSLGAIAGVWSAMGREVDPPHRPLRDYGRNYRWHVQQAIWAALGRGDWRSARTAWSLGLELLPRRTDRAYVRVPPAITWRVEHRALR